MFARSSLKPLAAIAMLSLGFLAGCGDDAQTVDLSAPSFDRSPIIRLNVAQVKVIDEFQPSFDGEHVEHLFTTSPARGVGIWTTDRLQAGGQTGVAEVHISDASVLHSKTDQFDRYDGRVAVTVRLYDGVNNFVAAEAQAEARVSKNIERDASVAKHEELFAQITRELTASIDKTLDANIRQNFGRFILSVQPR